MQSDWDMEHTPEARAAQVEQTLAKGFPTLFFPAELEAHFQREGEARRRYLIIEAGVAAVFLFGGMTLADLLLTPDTLWLAVCLRVFLFAPVILGGLLVVNQLRIPRLSEWLIAMAGMFAILITSLILWLSTSKWGFSRVVELNIIVVFTCTLARFWPALTLGAFALGMEVLLSWSLPDFTGLLHLNITLLGLVILIFTLYGNYTLERDERMAFLLALRERHLQDALQESHAQLARMATTDALTEVANRRHAEQFLTQSWAHAQSRGQSMALVLVDVDYFKRFNDHYGHQAGDRCLQSVARALSSCSRRAGDLVARLGGEEFLLIMSDIDQASAWQVAQRVRDTVQGMGIAHAMSGCAREVTVSVGVVTLRPGQADVAALLMKRADEALYAAKAAGRNQVCTLLTDGVVRCLGPAQASAPDAALGTGVASVMAPWMGQEGMA